MFIVDLQSICSNRDRVNCEAVSLLDPKPKKSGDNRLASGFENTKRFSRRNHQLLSEPLNPGASSTDVAEMTRIEQAQRQFVTIGLTKAVFEQWLAGEKLRFYQLLRWPQARLVSRSGTGLRTVGCAPSAIMRLQEIC